MIIYRIKIAFLVLGIAVSMIACSSDAASLDGSSSGEVLSGSYARMLGIGDKLYLLGTNTLHVLNISNESAPEAISNQFVTESIESLFFNEEHLFVGSQEGMFIYSLDDGGIPQFESVTSYEFWPDVLPCDPIAANDSHAFSTLSTTIESGSPCQRWVQINELRVFDITNVQEPINVNTIQMEEPKGIGIDGDLLFICENNNGIRVYDIADPTDMSLIYSDAGFVARDVIAANGLLLVMGDNKIHQYDYTDIENINKLSLYEIKD